MSLKPEILYAAERNLSEFERFKYVKRLKAIWQAYNIEHSMAHLEPHDEEKARRLIWC